MKKTLYISLLCSMIGCIAPPAYGRDTSSDPYLWLEDIAGKKALDWVKKQNLATVEKFEDEVGFQQTFERLRKILDSKDRIPYPSKYNEYVYNFWRDAEHPRGIYRRTTQAEFRKDNPAWETVLDLDELGKLEGENWVFKGIDLLYPDYHRAMVQLSRGGADATVSREFDLQKKAFVKDGFQLPESKMNIAWMDTDTLFVSTDFGPGSLTESGYPRFVKIWKRGTPLHQAKTIYKADTSSVFAFGQRWFSRHGHLDVILDLKTFFSTEKYLLQSDKLVKLDIPADSDIVGYFKKQLLLKLRTPWKVAGKTFKKGSLIIGSVQNILSDKPNFELLIEPSERMSIGNVATTKDTVLVTVLDNVVGKLFQFARSKKGQWQRTSIPVEDNGTISVFNTDEKSNDFYMSFESFLTPDTLFWVSGKTEKIKSLPAFFDSSPYRVHQYQTASKDGTLIPYFVVMRKDLKSDGNNPTLLYGYGGFQISLAPRYSGASGLWLEKGGIYVQANIRGGGEFGPTWHQAALKKNRHKAFEDFIAVAEDLIRRKLTSPQKLAIAGGSNGGLLVGAVMTMRPDLFKAVVCAVPLLDMKRYNKLLAGASWEAEYGDPDDPDMWNVIKKYSPYHNVKKGIQYPAILLHTSTRDDRVHPGHARKMTALMKQQGHKNVYYYENIEGGHAGAADNRQHAYMRALSETFLYTQLLH